MHCRTVLYLAFAALVFPAALMAQLPAEIFGGDKLATTDIMFFRYIKGGSGNNSRFLFFNRNRMSAEYKQTKKEKLPQFGNTEAISYNHPDLSGLAPVFVVQVSNAGIYPKAGVQFYGGTNELTFFTWIVHETLLSGKTDWFVLIRYEPAVQEDWKLYSQCELFTVLPGSSTGIYTFIQRLRLGLKRASFSFGAGADFSNSGNSRYASKENTGIFIRYEF